MKTRYKLILAVAIGVVMALGQAQTYLGRTNTTPVMQPLSTVDMQRLHDVMPSVSMGASGYTISPNRGLTFQNVGQTYSSQRD